jgi:hypothetical protein
MYLSSSYNPCEPLNRRWLRADYLFKNSHRPSPKYDDSWVTQAIAFMSALAACSDDFAKQELAEAMPAIFQAYTLFNAQPPALRWATEARILAREDFQTIGRKCALLPEAVEAYEQLFFCVLHRLEASTWVVCNVIGTKIHTGLSQHDLDVLWRLVGYSFGPLMLDAVIHLTSDLSWPETAKETDEKFAKDAKSLLKRKMAIATHMLPVTPENAAAVLQLTAKLGVLDKAYSAGSADDFTQSPMDAVVEQLFSQWSASNPRSAWADVPSQAGYEGLETNGLLPPPVILRAVSPPVKSAMTMAESAAV